MAMGNKLNVNGQQCKLVQEVGQRSVFLYEPVNTVDNLEEFVIDVVKVEVPDRKQIEGVKAASKEPTEADRIEGQLSFDEMVKSRKVAGEAKAQDEVESKQDESDKWKKHIHTSQTLPVDIIQKREETQPTSPQKAKEGKVELSREEVSEILRASIEQAMELDEFEEFDV
jgi:hypothetical protein